MRTQFIIDDNGKKLAVILPIEDYNEMIENLEELEDIKLYDKAKKDKDDALPIDDAFKLIEQERKNKQQMTFK